MPSQVLSTVENNFTKGLLTEFTGLNFPENAAIAANNTEFTLIGDVVRREGIDFEVNFGSYEINRAGVAVATYKWNNVGGDGLTQLVVDQAGRYINFWSVTAATIASPLSTKILASSIDMTAFVASGATFDATKECHFTDGNGYLFIFHPTCDPIYCSYVSGTITGTVIPVQIRDFTGVSEPGVAVTTRPLTLTNGHLYNLSNQGWTAGNPWAATATNSVTVNTGNLTFTVASGITGIINGQTVSIYNTTPITPGGLPTIPVGTILMSGNVVSYSSTSLVIDITFFIQEMFLQGTSGALSIVPTDVGFINTWFSDLANYPSNADVWWYFKDDTDVYNPTTQVGSVNLNSGQSPQGHFLLSAFNQNRSLLSGISGLTTVSTTVRPSNGAWFQGRVWYTGVSAQQPMSGDANYYTWTENIYFSQVVTNNVTNFGACYQTNDPTSETLFDLLPTDGGVLVIQGAGAIHRLFPIANGMLVFASNGVWFITGSQGIGFSANDYTITKISAIQSLSGTSYVDVLGLPYFWNEEGIYMVSANQQGSLTVEPLTVGTILTFYNNIPTQSKRYARAAYDPIGYNIQWIYKSTFETSVTDRYAYDSILNFNTYNKAFFPYSVDISNASINSIIYVSSSVETEDLTPEIKYLVSYPSSGTYGVTFADEHDVNFVDWASSGDAINYTSTFTTGYKLHGQGQRRFQIPYIYVFSRLNGGPVSYKIQSVWDYANTGNSGRWSTNQLINVFSPNYDMWINRIRLRGQGIVLQLQFTSVDGMPFDIIGWSSFETTNTGI